MGWLHSYVFIPTKLGGFLKNGRVQTQKSNKTQTKTHEKPSISASLFGSTLLRCFEAIYRLQELRQEAHAAMKAVQASVLITPTVGATYKIQVWGFQAPCLDGGVGRERWWGDGWGWWSEFGNRNMCKESRVGCLEIFGWGKVEQKWEPLFPSCVVGLTSVSTESLS